MKVDWLLEAVSNNALWCDAVSASHGISANWTESVWSSKHPVPPLYPNLITLKRGAQINDIIDTLNPQLPIRWGIKDSFNDLDLEGKGFTLAFNAHWYCRLSNQHSEKPKSSGFHLKSVQSESDLNRWTDAWGEASGVFKYSLLTNNDIELIYTERNGEIVSGLATNQSGDSVGISNSFGLAEDLLSCVANIAEKHPMKGIVGYGSKAEVAHLSKIGFDEIGDLRVWLRG